MQVRRLNGYCSTPTVQSERYCASKRRQEYRWHRQMPTQAEERDKETREIYFFHLPPPSREAGVDRTTRPNPPLGGTPAATGDAAGFDSDPPPKKNQTPPRFRPNRRSVSACFDRSTLPRSQRTTYPSTVPRKHLLPPFLPWSLRAPCGWRRQCSLPCFPPWLLTVDHVLMARWNACQRRSRPCCMYIHRDGESRRYRQELPRSEQCRHGSEGA
mmetsp:Transcript_33540/g.77352  ORF Transcript_33540/g.77352 Transcript_33540/m.77352 type:complete len:214 (-) Transcript_33540:235-876(-)